MAKKITKSIEVEVPLKTAYDQWTQFETFPEFMNNIDEVVQKDDTHLHWKASVDNLSAEWDAEITDQDPDQGIAWRSTSGPPHTGLVTFESMGQDTTRVNLEISYEAQGVAQQLADKMGLVEDQIEQDLENFKQFIEGRGAETGAWRGSV